MVLERQGRVGDAVALLQAHLRSGEAPLNYVEQLADLLARHNREAEQRDLAAGPGDEGAAFRLAGWLEEQARADEAIDVLRPLATAGSPNAAAALAGLLVRHGRVDEAIEVLRPVPQATADPECIVDMLCNLLIDQGRADEALAVIEDLAARGGGTRIDIARERSKVLARSGQVEQAIAQLRDFADSGADYVTTMLADLLVDAARADEAVAVLRAGEQSTTIRTHLAKVLIGQGRVREAVELFHAEAAKKRAAQLEEDAAFWRRFRAGAPAVLRRQATSAEAGRLADRRPVGH
ncbi:tetratricopeptide repeat protein [Dactylosporangium darangshiense]|uniref:Tetratricopeptide repeat protein n=1 Tax=Dactylosporangium darangshiense TaxID=579108 RepID=A0ABP8D9D1_9ACTN